MIAERKYADADGNVYAVERSARNGRYVVIRTNPGGHRKVCRAFPANAHRAPLQITLNIRAEAYGWKEAVG